MTVEHVELALHLHRVAVDGIFDVDGRIGIEMAETAAEEGGRAHLPEQPVHRLRAGPEIRRQEGAEFFGEIDHDGGGFEDAQRLPAILRLMVHQRRDLRIRIDADEARAELVALADIDQPGIVLRARVPGRQQLFEQDRHFHAVGCAERIKLQRMLADRQRLLMRRARYGAVDIGELAAIALVPGPDLRHHIAGGEIVFGRSVGHASVLDLVGSCPSPLGGERASRSL